MFKWKDCLNDFSTVRNGKPTTQTHTCSKVRKRKALETDCDLRQPRGDCAALGPRDTAAPAMTPGEASSRSQVPGPGQDFPAENLCLVSLLPLLPWFLPQTLSAAQLTGR